mmetsp:Transcript_110408/g.330215  ORF Transcript_110408/g.330215 Transcript_110408/m.330215 type:complete len:268 (-) Transcript_110408:34-837(-)|eukprot:CAMPEP_0175226654 /NCGR_PEP_ID=MMETSP0093-20121207/23005_1 /TAXON_ID=311494 /ORGANISM="Alexandrium monilatum, Strain CCMP3105" /LENGTH=267 /DNA_ID=CAMNT_0016520387 /DNA_START=144 /DNA_END=947 /DNA_ORIENTATION=+
MADFLRACDKDALEHFDGLTEVPDEVASAVEVIAKRPQELRSFGPKRLARTALAAASVTPVNFTVLGAVCELVASADPATLAEYEPLDLTAFAWALAVSDHQDEASMTVVGWQLAERAWEFGAEDLAKVVVAFAELGLAHQAMMATVSMEVMWKIDQFSAHSLAQVAEACARLGYCKEPMFDWLAARVIGRLEDYGPDDLASVMWAFAEASIHHDVLFDTVAGEVGRKWPELEEWQLSRFLWAFDKLGVVHRGFTQPLFHPSLCKLE